MTFEFGDDARRAIAIHYGQTGKASRDSMADWVRGTVEAQIQDIMHDAEQEEPNV